MRNNKSQSTLKTIFRVLKLDISLSPGWIALDSGAMLVSAVCYAYATIIKQKLFDTISEVVTGKKVISALIWLAVAVILFQLFNELLNAVCNFTWSPAMRSTGGKIRRRIHEKIARIPGNYFEDVKYLELIEKANTGAERCYFLYNNLATIVVFYIPYFVVLGIYLYKLSPVLLFSLLFIFIPMVVNLSVRKKIFAKQIDLITPEKRKMDYYESEIYNRDYLKENRVFGSFGFLNNKYVKANSNYSKIRWNAEKKNAGIEILLRSITLVGYLGVIALIVWLMIDGTITVGAFAAVFSSITTMIAFMNDALGNHFGSLFEHFGPIRCVTEFFDLKEEPDKNGVIDWSADVEVKNLVYSYPNTNIKAIDNVSFTIKNNETIALVGENGAGKSTLVKLILGILHPDSGEVLVGGKNIHECNTYYRSLGASAVFQNYNRYKMSIKDNVIISSDTVCDRMFSDSIKNSEFVFDEKAYTNGYDTLLSKEFGGVDLSGGQWQRLAIARGLYRFADFIVLDEPTSAIDPIEESVLYNKFRQITSDKKSIIVTHRMGSAKIADKIIVMQSGKISESGSYAELIKKDGEFAKLFNEQAQWYADGV